MWGRDGTRLKFVKSARAKTRIRQSLSKEPKRKGRRDWREPDRAGPCASRDFHLQGLMTGHTLLAIARELGYPDMTGLLTAVR